MTNRAAELSPRLTILVPGDGVSSTGDASENREMPLTSVIAHAPVFAAQVSLDKVKTELLQLQQQLDQLFSGIKESEAGYHLSQIQVAVGISGQGSIGIVSAGMQASITLVYSVPGEQT